MVAPPVSAQIDKLDQTMLIEGLRQEGLRELLKHFAETRLGDDPVLQSQVLLNQQLLDYEDAVQGGDMDTAASTLNEAVRISREMIDAHHDHEQRPIWQTQLAERLLFERLGTLGRNADRFYEFGVPTREQRELFESVVPEVLAQIEDADVRFFTLQSELPKQTDHNEKRVNTGLWDRMIEQFYNVRTQYMLAHATYYASMLPDEHAYYQNLGDHPRIKRQKSNAVDERRRLLSLAAERLETLLSTGKANNWNIGAACESLLGRVRLAQDRSADAVMRLEEAVQRNKDDMQAVWAHLGLVLALEARGRTSEAMAMIETVEQMPQVKSNMLLRILTIDAAHRLLLQRAEGLSAGRREDAVADAYQPYIDLLSQQNQKQQGEQLRNFIHQRWAASIDPRGDMSDKPAVVVGAVGRMLRIEGQNLQFQARQQNDDAMREQATEKLRVALQINRDLLNRDNLVEPVAAQAMHNQAVCIYFLGRDDADELLRAAGMMIDLAEQYPDQPVAEEAIASAVSGVLHPLHAQSTPVAGAREAYVRAMDVLLAKFPSIPAAANERFYFASRVLMPAGDYARAAEVLKGVPFDHPTYFEAQRERLYSRLAQLQSGTFDEAAALKSQASTLETEARQAASRRTGEAAAAATNAAGHARLVRSDIAAYQDDADDAISLLSVFEQEYAGDTELMREALARRIGLLTRVGRYDDAVTEARTMMSSYPDAAAPVIDTVLTDLDTQIQNLERQADDDQAERIEGLAKTARTLAGLLVDWAEQQDFSEDQMVPYQLVLARSLRLSGDVDKARDILEPLMEQYGNEAQLIHEMAETYYVEGADDALVRAGQLYSQLTQGLRPDEDGQYPALFFHAWMRFIQVCDRLNQYTDRIPMMVRQLKQTDPNLGGEPYKTELETIANKHAIRQ